MKLRQIAGLIAVMLVAATGHSFAQGRGLIEVDIRLARTLYLMYEPIVCSVTITNRSGQTLDLADSPQHQWFGFEITTTSGRPLAAVNRNYQNQPMQLPPGGRLVRNINLTPLYPLNEFGTYRIKAVVYSDQLKQYFASPQLNVEITEGRLLWQQTVGVPAGAGPGKERTLSLLSHRLPKNTMLYVRVEDKDAGVVYCTTQLGRVVFFGSPDVMLDTTNNVHILQNTAPKAFLYSSFDVNGKLLQQQGYQAGDVKPGLVRKADGSIVVSGGTQYDPRATPVERTLPTLNDRPVPLPTPQGKEKPDPDKPKNLLSQ